MSKERELLHAWLCITPHIVDPMYEKIYKTTKEILAQPENTEQEPVAWIIEWVQRYRYDSTPVMDRAVSFTKDGLWGAEPNYIPLYTSPPKQKPLIKLGADDE